MPDDYNTQISKENSYQLTRFDYINYLHKECKSKLRNPNINILKEILGFLDTPDGKLGFEKFKSLNPEQIGIYIFTPTNPFKKVFTS